MENSMAVSERVRLIYEEAQRLAFAARNAVAAYIVFVTAAGVLADRDPESSGLTLLVSVAQLGFGYFLVVEMLKKGELATQLRAGFGTYFGLTLLSSIAIGFGLVFLLIPGIFLFVRWAPLYPLGLVEGEGVGTSFSSSFAMTEGHTWPILVALTPVVVLQVAFAFGYIWMGPEFGPIPIALSAVGNLGVSAGLVGIAAVCTAVFSLLDNRTGQIASVFE